MTTWKKAPLGESVQVQGGYAFKSKDFTDVGVPVVRMSNIKDGKLSFAEAKYLPWDFMESHRKFLLECGDLILGMSGSIENFAVVKEHDLPALLNQRVGRFVVQDREKMNHSFLRYVITSRPFKHDVMLHAAGAAQLNISAKQLESIDIPYPPLAEQQKIADILTSVDDNIEKTEAIIDQTDDLKKGLMQDLLTKGIGHTKFKQTAIGEIPAAWEVVTIEDYLKEYRGGASLAPKDFTRDGVKVLPKKGVTPNGFLTIPVEEQTYTSKEFSDRNSRSLVDRTFLITVLRDLVPSGPNMGRIVEIIDDETYILAQGVYGFQLHEGLDETFLIYLSNASFFRKEMKRKLVGSTQVHMRTKDFFNTMIPLPDLREQEKIVAILSSVDGKLQKEQQKLNRLNMLKASLMQRLLTGKTRVTIDKEKEVAAT